MHQYEVTERMRPFALVLTGPVSYFALASNLRKWLLTTCNADVTELGTYRQDIGYHSAYSVDTKPFADSACNEPFRRDDCQYKYNDLVEKQTTSR
jgi:hypothetical protein